MTTSLAATPKNPTAALHELASNPAAHEAAEVSYQVGNEHWRGGETLVRVQGNGHVTVKNRASEKEQVYSGSLPPKDLKEFLGILADNNFTEQHSSRSTGAPDEARMLLRFVDPAAGIDVHNQLWDNERWQNPALKTIVAKFQALMKQTSHGKIRF